MKNLIFISIFILTLASCSSDKEDPIEQEPDNNITYSEHIKSIIDSQCNICHSNPPSNGAPMSLISLENVKEAITDRDLIGRVENGSMPPGNNDLTTDQIQLIKDWEENNFK